MVTLWALEVPGRNKDTRGGLESRSGLASGLASAQPAPKKYFLALLCIGKNESMVIRDFIQHYIEQGVEHIYAIDNGSTDDTAAILKTYASTGYVSYFYMPEPGENYNTVLNSTIRNECEWIMVNDVDEYVFGMHKTLKEYITNDLNSHDYLQFRMVNHGSSGHIKHPKDVRCSFVHRYPEELADGFESRKAMVRVSKVDHVCKPNVNVFEVPSTMIRMNHYISMSLEYWEKVKMTRGDTFDMATFDMYNRLATVEDHTLHDIVLHGYTRIKIGVPLSDGLGNIMFQIATGMAYCKRHRFEMVLYDSQPPPKVDYWDTILTPFKPYRVMQKPVEISEKYGDPQYAYTEIPKFNKSTEINGYYQSARYFMDEYPALYWKSFLKPSNVLSEDAVALHVRRGAFTDIFVQNGVEYYGRALEHLSAYRNGAPLNIVVFSNDLQWCRKELAPNFTQHTWAFYEQGTDWEQLCAMSSARDLIIANSTYSWWAAFAHQQPDHGIVIAPKASLSIYDGLPWVLL